MCSHFPGACFRIALFIAFGHTSINALLTPQTSKLHATQNIANLQQALSRTTQIKFSCSLLAILILGFSGDTILGLFGEDFTPGYTTHLLLAVGQLIIAAVGPVDLLLNLTGHQDRCMVAFSSALPIALILNLLLVPTFGMLGAAAVL